MGEILGIFESYFSILLITTVMPVFIIFLLIKACRDIKILDKKQYKEMFGVFYKDFGKKKYEGLLY